MTKVNIDHAIKGFRFYLTIAVLLPLVFSILPSYRGVPAEEKARIGFFSDIHFEAPAKPGTRFGGVEVDGTGGANYEIPVLAEKTIKSIAPDFLFDSGDMTAHGEFKEYEAYRDWRDVLGVPVYPVMGNHDRQHNSPSLPYGTGFYSILGYNSATRVLKLGNLVFILLSEDHHYEFNPLDAAVSNQKFQWLEDQLKRYAEGENNVFIIEHYPIKETVAWSDYYYGLGGFRLFGSTGMFDWWWTPWKRTSKKWKNLLKKYEDAVVAHVSGHIHLPYGWRDVPKDREIYGYGDGNWKVENVGQFVSGKEINETTRNYPPLELPEVYFLNIRALDYNHQAASDFEPSGAVYYGDMVQGEKTFELKAVDIVTKETLGSYTVKLDHPVNLGNGKIYFVNSDLGIRSKGGSVIITENDWFTVERGESGWVTFQKAWNGRVKVAGIEVIAKNGGTGRVYYRGSRDNGNTWGRWSTKAPENVDVLQVRTAFQADDDLDMTVHDVKVITRGEGD